MRIELPGIPKFVFAGGLRATARAGDPSMFIHRRFHLIAGAESYLPAQSALHRHFSSLGNRPVVWTNHLNPRHRFAFAASFTFPIRLRRFLVLGLSRSQGLSFLGWPTRLGISDPAFGSVGVLATVEVLGSRQDVPRHITHMSTDGTDGHVNAVEVLEALGTSVSLPHLLEVFPAETPLDLPGSQ